MPLTQQEIQQFTAKACQLRKDAIDTVYWAGGGHIGGSLSFTEIMILLYYKYARIDPKNPGWDDRDRIVVSKGHAGVGYAPILADKGYFPRELLKEFNHTGSILGMHLDGNKVPGVDVSTGSLGHGLPITVGLGIGARLQGKSWLTYCVLGDGECDEGSVWEAAMAAAHYKVTNIITIVDRNRMMIDGPTEEVMRLEPFADKWKAFGWIVKEVDGHDFNQLADAIEYAQKEDKAPVVIIAHTIKGKCVDFMEDKYEWHYGGLDSEKVELAKACIEKHYCEL